MRKSRMRAPPSASASRTAGTSLGRRQAEQTAAAAGAADLGGLGAGGDRARDQRIDRRRGHAGSQALAVLPFGGEAGRRRVPVAAGQRLAHGGGGVADPFEAIEDVLIAVDVPLGDLPVVGARIARLAGVAQHDAPLELLRLDIERHARQLSPASSSSAGDAAVHGRPIVLQPGRHLDHLGLDVLRDLQERLGSRSSAEIRRQGAADGDVQRRRAGNAAPGGRLAARRQADAVGAEAMDQPAEQRQRLVVAAADRTTG